MQVKNRVEVAGNESGYPYSSSRMDEVSNDDPGFHEPVREEEESSFATFLNDLDEVQEDEFVTCFL